MKLIFLLAALMPTLTPVAAQAEELTCGTRYARAWIVTALLSAGVPISCMDDLDERLTAHCSYVSQDYEPALLDLRMRPVNSFATDMSVWRLSSTDDGTWTLLGSFHCDCSSNHGCDVL
jgi:hypothetical protein